jgi:ribosomal protein S18 acetylase RimI-like enzyme
LSGLIRPVVLADEPFLWKMLYQAIYVPVGITPPSRDILSHPEIRRYLQDWGQPHDTGFIAVDQESAQPIGAAWLRLLTGNNKGYGYMDETTPELTIAVVPVYRGKGVGTNLLTHLLAQAQDRYPALCLSVSPDNPAMRLYQRSGFEVVKMSGTSLTMIRRWNP